MKPFAQNRASTVFLAVLCASACFPSTWADEPPASEEAASLKQLQDDFVALRFGMFIHYNMATYKGVQWVEGYPDPSEFNPGGTVDTDAWADASKAAGMTYAVLTTKHVSGFCLEGKWFYSGGPRQSCQTRRRPHQE